MSPCQRCHIHRIGAGDEPPVCRYCLRHQGGGGGPDPMQFKSRLDWLQAWTGIEKRVDSVGCPY